MRYKNTMISEQDKSAVVATVVRRCGSAKIVFGTDMPWYSPHYAAGFAKGPVAPLPRDFDTTLKMIGYLET